MELRRKNSELQQKESELQSIQQELEGCVIVLRWRRPPWIGEDSLREGEESLEDDLNQTLTAKDPAEAHISIIID